MTREELVKQKAQEFASRGEYSPTLTESFVAGAEWGHKYLIEKVEKYLREYIILYVWATDLGKREVWFDDFRKAMKE